MASEEGRVPYYRYAVGMRHGYDRMAAVQLSLLWALGLREQHTLCDVGCGSLRGGRLLIPYLAPGNYYGIEPNQRLVADAIEHEVGAELLMLATHTSTTAPISGSIGSARNSTLFLRSRSSLTPFAI